MRLEILVEDQSGGKAMDILIPKIVGKSVDPNVRSFKGIGRLPSNLQKSPDPKKDLLLHQLPKLLRGYGNTPDCGPIMVVCDLDKKDRREFLSELQGVLDTCNPKPMVLFCLAIEEIEAWYLGDLDAVLKAYPKAKQGALRGYQNDSICGTWEFLADAVCKGGSKALLALGDYQPIGAQKYEWAERIAPHMDVDANRSPSFREMVEKLRSVV